MQNVKLYEYSLNVRTGETNKKEYFTLMFSWTFENRPD